MFQIVEPDSLKVIFEGDIPDLMQFAKNKKMSAHIYFEESKHFSYKNTEPSQMVGILDSGNPYWIAFNPSVAIGKS